MRKSTARRLLTGFLPALFLAGCFNLNTGEVSVKSSVPARAPFDVDLEVGEETLTLSRLFEPTRTVDPSKSSEAGNDDSMSLINSYANFSQLVVVDGANGSILSTDEARRQEGETGAVFRVPSLTSGRPQLFLLLMGHKVGNESPTLLAAGFTSRSADDQRKVLLYMWPIQVKAEPSSSLNAENGNIPVKYVEDKKMYELWPADWKMNWELTTAGGGDPLAPLIAAQEAIAVAKNGGAVPPTPPEGKWDDYSSKLHSLKVRNAKIKFAGQNAYDNKAWGGAATLPKDGIKNPISWDMRDYTWGSASYGNWSSANFNLEYVPFNLTDSAVWRGRNEITLGGEGLPVWIIRHGINDERQDENTDFTKPPAQGNANGAVAFHVKYQRYWSAQLDNNGNYAGPAPGVDAWGMKNSSFMYGGQSSPGILVSVNSVWDDYNDRFLTGEESSGVIEFEIDWGKVTYVESYPSNYEELLKSVPDNLVGGLRFLWDDNKQEQRLVRVIDGGCTWDVYVKGTLRKGIKDTAEDWTGTSSFILKW
jgi:hypothetical protein